MNEKGRLARGPASVPAPRWQPVEIASYLFAVAVLWLVLELRLLGGLLAGLLVYHLIHLLAPVLARRLPGSRARLIALAFLSALIVGLLTLATIAGIVHFRNDPIVSQRLLDKAMDIIDQARDHLPLWVDEYLPDDAEDIRAASADWMRAHMGELRLAGTEVARGFAHIVIGMVLGAIIAVDATHPGHRRPLAAALVARAGYLAEGFRRIVFAQMKISLVNTFFTAVYLFGALPLFHGHLPLSKTLVLFTFIVGLLPVIGNLISNTAIITVALSVSLPITIASLVFLVAIHKLEYFLNARIVGNEIEARAWELLLAMLLMEAAFGIPGVIAAPIYYAYAKRELRVRELV